MKKKVFISIKQHREIFTCSLQSTTTHASSGFVAFDAHMHPFHSFIYHNINNYSHTAIFSGGLFFFTLIHKAVLWYKKCMNYSFLTWDHGEKKHGTSVKDEY